MREAQHLAGRHAGWLMAALTSVYGVGQIVGPLLASYVVHVTGSFAWSLLIAAASLAAAGLTVYPEIFFHHPHRKGTTDALRKHQDHA
jgi:MFS family permease